MSKINKGLMTSKEIKWNTPKDFFEKYQQKYNIQLDVCASPGDQLCNRYFAPPKSGWSRMEHAPSASDGLITDWCKYLAGPSESAWMNPPYGREIKHWVNKARREWELHGVRTVCLLPSRTDTGWFQNDVIPVLRGQIDGSVDFIRGRLHFTDANTGNTGPAPFPSVIVVFGT